jgi:quercetin dioxygenase-like cupin family protein
MRVVSLPGEREFDLERHVEKVLALEAGGDASLACWEPGQISPYHCHPYATEIYLCLEGGGVMRTPEERVPLTPGSLVLHPEGEIHEYENGPARSVLFRVRYGGSVVGHTLEWRGRPGWRQPPEDVSYFAAHPPPPGGVGKRYRR